MKNRNILFSLALSVLVLFNTLRVSLNYLYYNIDTKGFIEALCENKDKPELACNGKCHLKKITKTSNNSEKAPIQLIEIKDILLFNEKPLSYTFKDNIDLNKQYSSYLNLYTFCSTKKYFHPPKE